MTWKKLKELIDKQLAELGADENVDIWFIDISFPDEHTTPEIRIDKDHGLAVS
jgi:hypothetical protein